jgi:hypothetical protein
VGTNFFLCDGYWYDFDTGLYIQKDFEFESIDHMAPEIHIGKRSAAGLYCWDCNVTLCQGGNTRIHYSGNDEWHDECPRCGGSRQDEKNEQQLRAGPVALELGFVKPSVERPTGVKGCSSFSWAQPPDAFRVFAEEHQDEQVIQDEYGRKLTAAEFMTMLKAHCPIQFLKLGEQYA